MNRYPSLVNILRVDAKALLSILIPFVLWLLDLTSMLILGAEPAEFTAHNFALLIIASAAFCLRVGKIYALYNGGIQISAKVVEVSFEQIKGKIKYAYAYLGHEYSPVLEVFTSRLTRRIMPGDHVTAMIDLDRPRQSFLLDLCVGRKS